MPLPCLRMMKVLYVIIILSALGNSVASFMKDDYWQGVAWAIACLCSNSALGSLSIITNLLEIINEMEKE